MFATFVYLKLKGVPDAGLLDFFKIVRKQTQTIPSGPERLSLIEKAMQKAAAN